MWSSGPDVTIGRQCKIQNNVRFIKASRLKMACFAAPLWFTNIINPRAEIVKMDELRQTL
jgi:UDP-2-acetamido-3-amino-2,3-dideoxy-glucuronate N-acetyltransferase